VLIKNRRMSPGCRVVFGGENSDVFEGLVLVNHGLIESLGEGVELYKAR
jgi:hypothetical protein